MGSRERGNQTPINLSRDMNSVANVFKNRKISVNWQSVPDLVIYYGVIFPNLWKAERFIFRSLNPFLLEGERLF